MTSAEPAASDVTPAASRPAATRPVLLRVAIPHHYSRGAKATGYGSTRSDQAVHRVLALSRCLGGVLGLARGEVEQMLEVTRPQLLSTGRPSYPATRLAGIQVELHVFVSGDNRLADVLEAFRGRLTLHEVELEDSLHLPRAARDFLLQHEQPADLHCYLEDDLVIHDPLFVDKVSWFLNRTAHQLALMPHRYECTDDPAMPRLYVDGPIAPDFLRRFQTPQPRVATGRFWDGNEVSFDVASNPHSGLFLLSEPQRQRLRGRGVADEGFVGPLETVATYTVLQHMPVVKPSWDCRQFLLVEHAHRSYVAWRDLLLRRGDAAAQGAGERT
ncbi:hypothetical protein EVJ50_09025 [Synechococcus sp. RSCCF101]|uniref:hypothetical protein n=1 Tax=Synechococcus sp. RSCCF101 TaxID=2511069 RepID=UPI00124484D8|nr:hypothetical protein [Synechococcus sp. RSCCF101]QEY32341.1 hypothetical protein EVJ50_09025 [Synechococcus sp. RSCCF101]